MVVDEVPQGPLRTPSGTDRDIGDDGTRFRSPPDVPDLVLRVPPDTPTRDSTTNVSGIPSPPWSWYVQVDTGRGSTWTAQCRRVNGPQLTSWVFADTFFVRPRSPPVSPGIFGETGSRWYVLTVGGGL